jgi:DNA-binding response OmpR family regulator
MRAIVVEDEPSIALLEQRVLEHEGFEVSVLSSGAAAIDLVVSWSPDLVVLDHGLPDIDGREVLRLIRKSSQVPIIVVTARASESEMVESLDEGADDYIVKPFRIPELMARVRAVLRRTTERTESHGLVEVRDIVVDARSRRVTKSGVELPLTRIEFDILEALVRRPGAAVAREELARRIWSLPAARIGKSLDVHMSVLRRKLGDDPKEPSYIETVRGVGFRITVG